MLLGVAGVVISKERYKVLESNVASLLTRKPIWLIVCIRKQGRTQRR
jgi:hypothetical protein